MRTLAAAFILAAFYAGPALAQCPQWDVAGNALELDQSNNIVTRFDISQNGSDLSGTARYLLLKSSGLMQGQDVEEYTGDVDGSIDGSSIELRVRWHLDTAFGPGSGPIGVYRIEVDDNGRFTGETYDFTKPSSRAQLLGARKLRCVATAVATPPPPVQYHRLGKRSPAPAPSRTDGMTAMILPPLSASRTATCASGYVWREARPDDRVCVTPASRSRTRMENARAPSLWAGGAYGSHTCASGYVWREAFSGDTVCVLPETRELVREENRLASSRVAQ